MLKNKKADLLAEETLKIILAVMGIVVLFGLAFKLHGIFKESKLERASQNLENLYLKIQKIVLNQTSQSNVIIESPNEWFVVSWPKSDQDKSLPDQCFDYCICICEDKTLKSCNQNGACKNLNYKIKTLDGTSEKPLKIKGPILLKISKILEDQTEVILVERVES